MSSKGKRFLGIIIVLVLVLIFHHTGISRPVERLVRKVVQPNASLVYQLSVHVGEGEAYTFDSVDALKEAYIELQASYQHAQVDDAALRFLQEENEELKARLRYLDTHEHVPLTTEVIGKDLEPIGSTIIIGQGGKSGIQIGDPVIVGEGILIGIVRQVEADVSVIRLINDNQSKVAARLLNQDQSIGVVEGQHGISIQMNFIPQHEVLSVGDTVITSGLEEQMPAGLLIGEVRRIEKEPFRPFQKADLLSPVSLDKIRTVTVLLSQNI